MQKPTFEEARELLEELFQKHYLQPPYSEYVSLGSIPLKSAKENSKVLFPVVKDKIDLDGIVAFVELKKTPPENVRLFTDYKGLKVFYVKGEEIIPQ